MLINNSFRGVAMTLPSVIKIGKYKLIRNESYEEVLYSLILEGKSKSLGDAITNCINKAKKLEKDLKAMYGLVYYNFDVLSQVKEKDRWIVIVKVDFVEEEDEDDSENLIDLSDPEEFFSPPRIKIKDLEIIDRIIILNIIDELEMILSKPPKIRDVVDLAKEYGIERPLYNIEKLQKVGIIKIDEKEKRVSRCTR